MATKPAEGIGSKAGKLIGDLIIPGASQMLEGNVKSGVLHVVGGTVGRIVLGPVGWLYAAVNSFSNSTTHKHLHEHFTSSGTGTGADS